MAGTAANPLLVALAAASFATAIGCSPATAQAGPPEQPTANAVQRIAAPNANGRRTARPDPGQPAHIAPDIEPAQPPIEPRIQEVPVAVYDPSGRALATFHEALARAAAGQGQARIAWWGASHTAADIWSGHVRRALQTRYGDAGHGYLLPFRWHGGYRHQDVNLRYSKGWKTHRHKLLNPVPVGDYGYGGVAVSSDRADQWFAISTCTDNVCGRRADRFELWLKKGPEAGTAVVRIDGKTREIKARSRKPGILYKRFAMKDGAHTVRVSPKGDGELYVYGAVFERSGPGVIVDQMGIPGMRGKIMLHWEEAAWREQLRRRDPHLLIMAYGTNAVGDKGAPIRRFREGWRQVLERTRSAVPRASCLLVGPTDRPTRPDEEGLRHHRPRMDLVIAEQKKVAAEYGCAYWDAFAAMGGRGAMLRWVAAGLGRPDHVHLTREGYELKGDRFLQGILPPTQAPGPGLPRTPR